MSISELFIDFVPVKSICPSNTGFERLIGRGIVFSLKLIGVLKVYLENLIEVN